MFRNEKLGQGSTANRHAGLLKFGPSEVDERCLARTPLSEHSDNDALAGVEAENLLRKGARSSCSTDCVVLSAVGPSADPGACRSPTIFSGGTTLISAFGELMREFGCLFCHHREVPAIRTGPSGADRAGPAKHFY